MSNTQKPRNGADILARIQPKLAEESTEICLRPDLLDSYAEATEALAEAHANRAKEDKRMASNATPEARAEREAAERVQEVEAELKAASVEFHFRALPKDEMRALKDEHPPRKGNDIDTWKGYNVDAVIDASVRLSLVDPVFDEESWDQLVATINDGEWEEMRRVANTVNGNAFRPPKSLRASEILTRADAD